MKKNLEVKKQCDFIQDGTGKTYISRPTSWMGGRARHLWFEHNMGIKPTIASNVLYEDLTKSHSVCTLTEYSDGSIKVYNPKEEQDGVS